jgi:hypothetical protein
MTMRRRSFLWALMGGLVGLRSIEGIGAAFAAEDELLLVNGWIVRRSQLPRAGRGPAR